MSNKALVVIDIQNDITKHYRDIIGNINAAIECVKDHVLQIHKQIYAKYEGDFDRIYTEGYNSKSYTVCRKHEAVVTVWTSLSAIPSMPRRASIRELVQVKPSSSEWEVINVNSSHFYAEYPKCLAVSEIMCNFAVENQ